MKPTEVMIGDYVIPHIFDTDGKPSKSKIVGIHYNSYRGKDYVDWVDCEVWDELDMDDIKPILLTPEILEKIGFSKVPQTGCSNPYHWEIEKYEEGTDCLLYRIKAYTNPFRGVYISIDNFGDCEPINFGKQIESLHEFQHALHLCGIEKEIVL